MILQRTNYSEYGIFGTLTNDLGGLICRTLEHAYPTKKGFRPKVPEGDYRCVRGIHRLKDLVEFETFEIMNVPGHTGILFHVGNANKDTDGCILLGLETSKTILLKSRVAFLDFMSRLKGINQFNLKIIGGLK